MTTLTNKIIAASTAIILLAMTSGLPEALSAPRPSSIQVIPTVTSVLLMNGQLVATGNAAVTIHGRTTTVPFSSPVDITVAQAGVCPVLDLRLAPIHLNVLGLAVDTSPICLTITAIQGGGLLGDLLCSLGNLLNQGLSINDALATFSPSQLNTLLGGITSLLNGALDQLNQATLISIQQVGVHHTCAILHLALGPVNLTLLGLNVVLDNCSNGPVTVDITGITGQGNLLGNLLCELLGGGLINIGATLQNILNQILGLLNQ